MPPARDQPAAFVPAAGRHGLTALYDPVVALTMREERWRARVLEEVQRPSGDPPVPVDRVLDLGCGTGTLAVALAQRLPGAVVAGVDVDPAILERAAAKADRAGVRVEWREARAGRLPFAAGTFQRVTCTLVLHHLLPGDKIAALRECRRVLQPGGRLVVADWGRPQDPVMRAAFFGLQLLDGFGPTGEHARGLLPARIAAAGLRDVRRVERLRTPAGTLEILVAERS
ncbi:class I SAM-dependent methyltransferase [Paraconexibacter sp. AEG42_29]|uniref:class I SAM-dependent methyltransferase n=1 Tax=Paraconexibacter sp. AEG42_29 TaxID=2997339 RepID=UPI00339D963F